MMCVFMQFLKIKNYRIDNNVIISIALWLRALFVLSGYFLTGRKAEGM